MDLFDTVGTLVAVAHRGGLMIDGRLPKAERALVADAGATIIGGLLFGFSRKAATEFSFFLAVPTLVAAGAWDAWSNRELFAADYLGIIGVGLVTSFVSAFLCIRWLLRFVVSHDFTIFAWYRILFGALVLITAWTGLVDWTAG